MMAKIVRVAVMRHDGDFIGSVVTYASGAKRVFARGGKDLSMTVVRYIGRAGTRWVDDLTDGYTMTTYSD